ncbi:M1 family metallopeptidase [Streptomyces sp. NBC_01465]|uniref:M1 family metallopeptidase n=1 Tax=Streptomyces sp. NBC_01465 TaxID=2903878 RepID=UPI002E37B96E|nr:M1 family metallopeptidase [Streptomyces sp. NBC_01465]
MREPHRRFIAAALSLGLAAACAACSPDDSPSADAKPSSSKKASPSATPVRGTPGATGLQDSIYPSSGNGGYDAIHYDLALNVVPKTSVVLAGTSTMTARATQDLSRFNLDLSGFTVKTVTVDNKKAAFTRAGTELTVTPAQALAKGAEFKVAVTYGGNPKSLKRKGETEEGWLTTDDGALVMGEPLGAMTWYPVNDTVRDPATYDIAVTVPMGLTAVSVGTYAGKDGNTFRWHDEDPTIPYQVTLAVGKFELSTSTTKSGIPVVNAIDPRQNPKARTFVAKIPEIIAWGEKRFGPYPFHSAGAIVDHDPKLGVALETIGRPLYGKALDPEVMVHEYAHMWFGDSVRLSDWSDIWLNEGFATYAEWLWSEDHGSYSAKQWFDHLYEIPAGDKLWAYPPGKPVKGSQVFGLPVYYRGAMVLHQVRKAVGDKAFFKILKTWTAERKGTSATTAQFIALCEKTSGKQLDKVFATWLYGKGKPARG